MTEEKKIERSNSTDRHSISHSPHQLNLTVNHRDQDRPLSPSGPKSAKIEVKKISSEKSKKGTKISKKLKEEIRLLEKEKEELSKPIVQMEEIITLNVGGVVYTTTRTTLMKEKGTLLYGLSSGRYDLVKDSQGRYFIDRDGHIFRYILNYLRSDFLGDLSKRELILLRPEAEFYCIPRLVNIIDVKLKEHFNSKFAVLRYNENQNVNHLSWQGKTEPCKLTKSHNLYKYIDEVLTEVDNRGWELLAMSGDGWSEGGWMYVFKKKPPIDHRLKFKLPHDNTDSNIEDKDRRGHNKFKSYPFPSEAGPLQRKKSGSL